MLAICCALALVTTGQTLDSSTDVLITSPNCPPCEVVKRFVPEDTVIIDRSSKLAEQFRASRVPTPTLLVRENGRIVAKFVGSSQILKYWKNQ